MLKILAKRLFLSRTKGESMNSRKDKVVAMGEIMLRLTPPDYTRIDQAGSFLANYGGGEANVIVSLSHLGHNTYFVSKLPPNQLGDGAIDHLRSHGVKTDYVVRGSSNMGIYFLESGFGGRPGRVIYNRKHSAITRINEAELDFDEIFHDASWFHLSGITLALSWRTRSVAITALKYAKKYNVPISFDFNYRSKLWTVEEAQKVYQTVVPYADVVFASPFDFRVIMQMGDEFDDDNLMYEAIKKFNFRYIFGKTRKIFSSTENAMRAYVYTKDHKDVTDEISFQIFDRIGAGDAFASGAIHGLITRPDDPLFAANFGLVNSILKQTIFGDVSTFTEEEILEYMETQGKTEVKR